MRGAKLNGKPVTWRAYPTTLIIGRTLVRAEVTDHGIIFTPEGQRISYMIPMAVAFQKAAELYAVAKMKGKKKRVRRGFGR